MVDSPYDIPVRSTGCHIHYSALLPEEDIGSIIRNVDAILGCGSVIQFQGLESAERRRFYGKPGEFRLQPMGLPEANWLFEYRTLSSAVMIHPKVCEAYFTLYDIIAKWTIANNGYILVADPTYIIAAITNNSVEAAKEVMAQNHNLIAHVIPQSYHVWLNNTLNYPLDIPVNWGF
jgi:hypothetical protein